MRFLKKIIGFYQRKDKKTKISSLNGAVTIKTQNVSDKYISHKRLRLNPPKRRYLRALCRIRLRPYRQVRTKSPSTEIIENSDVLVVCKYCVAFLG